MPDVDLPSKYPTLEEIEVPAEMIRNWQAAVDILSQISNTPAALVMRAHPEAIEVLVSSRSEGNVYHPGERAPLDSDLYCETVMTTRGELLVPNALKDPRWEGNPDVPLGMISYLGLPLIWPGGQVFGTICVLDKRENAYSPLLRELLSRFREDIQFCLRILSESFTARQSTASATESMRISDARLRLAVDAGNIGLWDWDLFTNRVQYSSTWKRQIGFEDHEIADDFGEWESRVHPEDLAAATARVQEYFRRPGSAFENVFRLRHKDGSYRTILARASLKLGEDGKPSRMLGAHVDVTERNAAEERLRVSEQRFRDVAASADEYIFEMDAQGAITYISDVVENVIGFRPDEIVGQSSLRFVSPAEHARSSAYLGERASRKEKISHFQQEAVHRSGRSVWLDISAVPTLAKDGTLLGYRGAALDVTKRQQAEEERAALQAQLAQAQKLESIGRLAGGVAHDFNNLLTVILGYGAEIQSGLVEGTPPDHESVDEIVAAARRASDLTKQLLAFARKQIVAPVALDLNEAVRESSKLLGRLIGEEIQVVHRLLEDLWSVRCDPGLVGQVIMNLGVNARDAMPGGGTFTLATANVTVPPDVVPPEPEMFPGEYVRFSLDDTGSGMTAEQLGHVFEPFFTTKEPGAGTGLGLATVYGIVKQCGAFVGVTSSPGKGTRFDIYFPRDEGPVVGPEAAPSRSRTGSETVLVVEDDEQVREVAVRALRSGGYRVLAAPGLLPAMEMVSATTEPIHLLVTDVVMPGGGGTDVTERISDLRPGIRVLFMSGYSHGATSRQGVLDEVTEFIPKPFTAAELRSRVRKVLDRTRPPRPQG